MSGWARYRRVPGARAGLVVLTLLGAIAVAPSLLASDLPLVARVDGRLYLLPALTAPAALRDEDNQGLAGRGASILLAPPIAYGPLSFRGGGPQPPLAPPSRMHVLGTDDRGRDVAARLVHGTRVAMAVGGLSVALALLLGLAVGAATALSRALDLTLTRVVEVGLAFPSFFLLLALQGVLAARRAPSLVEVAVVIGLGRFPEVARLVRAEAKRQVALGHVEAARALGAGRAAIALRHVLPAAASPALVAAAFGIGQAVLVEAGLGFLGLGVPPPTPTWGELYAEAHAAGMPWWLLAPPTIAIAVTVIASHRVAAGVRAALDPTE